MTRIVWKNIQTISVFVIFLVTDTCVGNPYDFELIVNLTSYDTPKTDALNQYFNYEHFLTIEDNLRVKFQGKWDWYHESFVPTPHTTCEIDDDCGYEMECLDKMCVCSDGLCIVYQYDPSRFIPRYLYTCGECGVLGSECSTNDDSSCYPPGTCHIDEFCHCSYGEHYGPDLCVYTDVKRILVVLLSAFVVFGIFGLAILGYICFLNYRRAGTLFWCSEYRRRRRNVPVRVNPVNGLLKTPAFTIENLYQFGAEEVVPGETSTSTQGGITSDSRPSTSSSVSDGDSSNRSERM